MPKQQATMIRKSNISYPALLGDLEISRLDRILPNHGRNNS